MERILFVGEVSGQARTIVVPGRDRCEIVGESSEQTAIDILRDIPCAAVVVGGSRPGTHALDFVTAVRHSVDPDIPVILVSPRYDADAVVEALRAGASDFVPWCAVPEFLGDRIRHVLVHSSRTRKQRRLQNGDAHAPVPFVIESAVMRQVDIEISRLAALDYDVLLHGETGVGKDLVAAEIHRRSKRRDRPFVPIPLRSLSESLIESELFGHERGAFSSADHAKMGRFEAADEGTVYIPEVSCLNESVQLKLLYFMQYKRTSRVGQDPRKSEMRLDVRVIMASNDDLEGMLAEGHLREDFYHRIAGLQLFIPPLRERKEDIIPLATAFLTMFSGAPRGVRFDFSPEALAMLQRYHWPGNVRQLENAVKASIAYARGPILGVEDLDHVLHIAHLHPTATNQTNQPDPLPVYDDAVREFQKGYFERLLARAEGNIARAARMSGLTPQWIRRMVKIHSLR